MLLFSNLGSSVNTSSWFLPIFSKQLSVLHRSVQPSLRTVTVSNLLDDESQRCQALPLQGVSFRLMVGK